VHASGQVGNFLSDLDSIEPERWHIALNSYLPPDIRALDSCEAPAEFNAKSSARQRVYRYFLYSGAVGLPHFRLYCWKIRRRPQLGALNALASVFLGEHDFTTFAASGDSSKSKVRRVDTAAFYPEGPFLCFKVAASSFVWKMVRSMLGTILEYEQNDMSPAVLSDALEARDRSRAGMSAPARGLFLERVRYDGDERI
jgi:tRNA pseudouridine38-40 synthase